MSAEAFEQYAKALKAGQKFYKAAVDAGENPYPPVLDELVDETVVAGNRDLGLVNVPAELIAGTKSAGRAAALAGNFMPLLPAGSEFSTKWISLCDAHLSDKGIRDPVKCYEYMGRFYVQEGNKRVSVLLSYSAPGIPAMVTRMIPAPSEDPEVKIYYEFMEFYNRAGLYGVEFSAPGCYDRLQALLGMDPDHVWTEAERSSFSAGFAHFKTALAKAAGEKEQVNPSDALLVWLQLFPFSDIKDKTAAELSKSLTAIWPDLVGHPSETIEVRTAPDEKEKGLVSKLLSIGHSDHIQAAFLYGFDPEDSAWTRDHERGRQYLLDALGDKLTAECYRSYDQNYFELMEAAVEDGAKLLFATMPSMVDASRRVAALHKDVRVLVCALSLPYTGVRMYYSRTYETKFITGAIAGAMAEGNRIGYIANYPIFGVPASINAFALGARMTNPRVKVKLLWSCLKGNPVREFMQDGITVISNRDSVNSKQPHWALEWGVYSIEGEGTLRPLAYPVWNWGPMYERIVRSLLDGTWDDSAAGKAVNYWWGMDNGVLDVKLSRALPDGVYSMARMLKKGLAAGTIDPFLTRIVDQAGKVRFDGEGETSFTPEERMNMEWLCDNVEGHIPGYEELLPQSQGLVRLLGLNREELPPEKAEAQL